MGKEFTFTQFKYATQRLLLLSIMLAAGLAMPSKLFAYDNSVSLWVGQTYSLDISQLRTYAMVYDITWTKTTGIALSGSNYTKKASVSSYFKGTGYVTCSYQYKQFSFDKTLYSGKITWAITCNDNPVSATPTQLNLKVGEQASIGYKLQYSNDYASSAQITYQVGTTDNIVTVSKKTLGTSYTPGIYYMNGTVTAVSPGQTYILVYSTASADPARITVTVTKAEPTDVSLPESESMEMGDTITLTPALTPEDTETQYTWSSDKEYVATVSSDGNVIGISPGTATIQVTTSNGLSSTCSVTVTATGNDTAFKIKVAKARMAWLRSKTEENINE